jgi:hypothetical protein
LNLVSSEKLLPKFAFEWANVYRYSKPVPIPLQDAAVDPREKPPTTHVDDDGGDGDAATATATAAAMDLPLPDWFIEEERQRVAKEAAKAVKKEAAGGAARGAAGGGAAGGPSAGGGAPDFDKVGRCGLNSAC